MVGLLTGLIAVVFHLSLNFGEAFRNHLIEQTHQYGRQGIFIVIGFTTLCVFVAAFLVKHYAPEASGSGIPHVKAALQGYRTFRWYRVLIVKFLSG